MKAADGKSVEALEALDAVADGAVGASSVALVAPDALAAELAAELAACVDALVDASGVAGFGAAPVAFAGVLLAGHVDALVVASA